MTTDRRRNPLARRAPEPAVSAVQEINAPALDERRAADPDLILIDVREPWEWAQGFIEGAAHVPLNSLPGRVDDFPRDAALVIYCAHGIRSWHAAAFMMQQGFTAVVSLAGGIDAWARWQRQSDPRA